MTRRIDVLVVEDEPVVRESARKILLEEDLSVVTANDVDEAMTILENTQCRIVLSDLMLPGASGFDLLESTRNRWPGTEGVMITGYATLENTLSTFQKGAFDFVAKPFDIGELTGVVRRALRFSMREPHRRTRPSATADGTADEPQEQLFFLGRHSWARLHADGSATLGVAETFPQLLGEIERVKLPAPEERSTQGRFFARFLTPGETIHRVWSPLSGIVLTANERLRDSAELIDQDPSGKGWLIRIIPDNLDRELDLLEQRRFWME
jgi:CheY-like chemotaxis protein